MAIQYYNIIIFIICLFVIYKGLSLYKIYIALLSGIFFGIVGLYLSIIFLLPETAFKIAGLSGFIVGVFISWFVYKIYIYINAFIIGYSLSLLFLLAFGINSNICLILASIGAIAIIYLTYKYFNTLVIINISVSAAFIIFLLVVPGIFDMIYAIVDLSLSDKILYNNELKTNFYQAMLQVISANLINLIIVLVIYVGFSLFLQKYYLVHSDGTNNKYNKIFQVLSYYFGIVAVIIFFLEQIFHISPSIYFGFSLHTWPLLLFILFHILKFITVKFNFNKRKATGWIILIIFAVILVPVINWLISLPFYIRQIANINASGGVVYIPFSESIIHWLNFPKYFYYNIIDFQYYFSEQSSALQIFIFKAIQYLFYILIIPLGFIISFKKTRYSK